MNKSELINEISNKTQLTKKDTEKAVNAFMDVIKNTLSKGDKVQLVGFGKFEVKKRAARRCINPRTREEIRINETKIPSFRPGKPFRDIVNR